MANVTIVDTVKTGWITVDMGDYYPDRTPYSQFNIRKVNISDIDLEDKDTILCVRASMYGERKIYFNNIYSADYTYSYTVDTINGAAPNSITDLRDKLLALL